MKVLVRNILYNDNDNILNNILRNDRKYLEHLYPTEIVLASVYIPYILLNLAVL